MSVTILQGDVRDVLATLPDNHFDCIVTSPPYWGLRDYGVAGQIGLEPTLTDYLDTMTALCRELRRVLKPEGTFWLNIGDSYSNGGRTSRDTVSLNKGNTGSRQPHRPNAGVKPKDLCMVPNRLAIRLQEDGWYVRSEIIWYKPNPMPESVTDRPTSSHEKVWLLTKSERYAYDVDAVREPHTAEPRAPGGFNPAKAVGPLSRGGHSQWDTHRTTEQSYHPAGRNVRNVWTIATQPYVGAHFATMAPDLAERCIKAGCPEGGHVLDPFGGAGTTGLVADRLGRHATLIELNPAYIEIAKHRIEGDAPLFAEVCA